MASSSILVRSLKEGVASLNGQAKTLGVTTPPRGVNDLRAVIGNAVKLIVAGNNPRKIPITDPQTAKIDVVDLFCGCGGISSGFRLFNNLLPVFRIAGALDIDSDAIRTYETNLGFQPFQDNAHHTASRRRAWERFRNTLSLIPGNTTVVVGGPPCQGFTSHKKSISACDDQNVLYPDFARIAVKLNADVVLMENVPELLTDRSWPFYAQATSVLKRAGYTIRTRVYNLAGFGLPQDRFRALTVAMKRAFIMPEPLLVEKSKYHTVRMAIGDLPRIAPGEIFHDDPEHLTANHKASTINTIRAVAKNGGRRPNDVGPACLRRLAERNGRSGYDDVYGRLWWDRPSVTITGSSRNPASGRFVHPEQHRGLSIREAALLQGFPPSYRFAGSLDSRFLQIGNAVPPIFAACVAGHILSELITNRKTINVDDRDVEQPLGSSFSRLIAGIKQGSITI